MNPEAFALVDLYTPDPPVRGSFTATFFAVARKPSPS